jgi:hypothetical protein
MSMPSSGYPAEFAWVAVDPASIVSMDLPRRPADLIAGGNGVFHELFGNYVQHIDAANAAHYVAAVDALATNTAPSGWSAEDFQSWRDYVEQIFPAFVDQLARLRSVARGCGICQEQPTDPIFLDCAGRHSYCHRCIAGWVQEGRRTCPLCRAEVLDNTMRDIVVQTDVDGILVRADTGTYTVGFSSITLDQPDRHQGMNAATTYTVHAGSIGGIDCPGGGYEMYAVSGCRFNAGTYNTDPLVFYRN